MTCSWREFEVEETVDGETRAVRHVQILDRNRNDEVVVDERLEDVGTVEILTGPGSDTVAIDLASFSGDGGQVPNFTVDTGDGEDRITIISNESVEWDLTQIPEDRPGVRACHGGHRRRCAGPRPRISCT